MRAKLAAVERLSCDGDQADHPWAHSSEDSQAYGVPFSIIPFKGRETKKAAPEDKSKSHLRALPERGAYEIRFPVGGDFLFAEQDGRAYYDRVHLQTITFEIVRLVVNELMEGPGIGTVDIVRRNE